MRLLAVAALLLLVVSCKNQTATSRRQGISGTVWWLEGDFMPRVGAPPPGKKSPVKREVLVYPPLKSADFNGESGPLYTNPPGKPVGSVVSDDNGHFHIYLPPGTYSVFTQEPDGLFANSFNSDGIINPVTVSKGSLTQIAIEINYRAAF